jgi:peptidoglycan/LPS O-acetylase OafA/YrhL
LNPPHNRNQSLDVLRCAAILLVLGFHLPYYNWLARAGWIGVDLFFVLSGFLISGLLFQEFKTSGSINIRRFLLRRGLKIYPSFYLLIAISAIAAMVKHLTQLRTQVIFSALFAQNYYDGTAYSILAHTWSLAVEEHFYLLLPPLLMLMIAVRGARNPFGSIPLLFGLVAVLCLGFRWCMLPPVTEARMTHMRLDSLFAGVTLGYLFHFKQNVFQRLSNHYFLAFGCLLCLPAAILGHRNRLVQTFGLTGLLLGFSLIVAWSVSRTPKSSIGRVLTTVAARVGIYSYSIYLWHMLIGELFLTRFKLSALMFWICITATIVVGIVMAHLVEMPYLSLRDKLFPSPTSRRPEVVPATQEVLQAVQP